jgi:hypothetical protein
MLRLMGSLASDVLRIWVAAAADAARTQRSAMLMITTMIADESNDPFESIRPLRLPILFAGNGIRNCDELRMGEGRQKRKVPGKDGWLKPRERSEEMHDIHSQPAVA